MPPAINQTPKAKKPSGRFDFHAVSGGTLAIWGVGVLLIALNKTAPKQLFVLPLMLLPLLPWALLSSLRSHLKVKREDASQIALVSAAGLLLSLPSLGKSSFYYILSAILLIIAIGNLRRRLSPAPLGVAIVFAAILAPKEASNEAVALLAFIVVLLVTYFGRYEQQIAQTSAAMLSGLYMLHEHGGRGWLPTCLAALYVAAVYYLRTVRAGYGGNETERRVFLDEAVLLSAGALAFASVTRLTESERYALLSLLFGAAFVVHSILSTRASLGYEASRLPPRSRIIRLVTWQQESRARTTLAAAALSLMFAINALAVSGFDAALHRSLRVFGVCLVSLFIYLTGRHGSSTVRRDLAKLGLVYAVALAYVGLFAGRLQQSSFAEVLVLVTAQYLAIIALVTISGHDLHLPVQGAWQGIFPGRALANIRHARSKVFEVLSQAPLVGWMFHLGDKAAVNLQEAFGSTKVWTIAHYSICLATLVGILASIQVSNDLLLNRLPSLGITLLGPGSEQADQLFQRSIAGLFATVVYGISVYVIGALANKQFLRYLSTMIVSFVLAILWFQSFNDKNPTSGWFFPLGFACFAAVARLATRAKAPAQAASGQPIADANPSIERTSSGKPAAASHVKR